MKREIIRVEPIDSNFEKWGAPVSTCTRAGNMVFVSCMPPFAEVQHAVHLGGSV